MSVVVVLAAIVFLVTVCLFVEVGFLMVLVLSAIVGLTVDFVVEVGFSVVLWLVCLVVFKSCNLKFVTYIHTVG